jgi:TadE-like protein
MKRNGIFGKRRGFSDWGERGQALVEFALVSVLFFMLSFGVFDLARLFQSWVTVQHASRESARYAITGRADCDGALSRDACIVWVAKNATEGLARAGVSGADVQVETEAWDYDFDTASWLDPGVEGDTGLQCDQIEVTVEYKHKFVLPVLSALAPGGVTVVGRQRMTNEPYAPCEDGDGTGSGAGPSPPAGTATPGPTATPVPPTSTPVPPTATPVPPTATPMPTATPVPPTPTNTPAPTSTPAPCPWWKWWC